MSHGLICPAETYPVYREYRPEDLDPGFVLWLALVQDVYDEDPDAGKDMLCNQVARVLVEARRYR